MSGPVSEKDNTLWTNLALWIKEICTALQTDLHPDLRRVYEENLDRLLLVLAGQMPLEAINSIIGLCEELHKDLRTSRYRVQNGSLATRLLERMDELRTRPVYGVIRRKL